MRTLLASMDIGRAVIVHTYVSQYMMAFGAAVFSVIGIGGFGRDICTAEVVYDRFLLYV